MTIRTIVEHEIEPRIHGEIAELRERCFPGFQRGRSYYKQLPHLRLLAYDPDQRLIGHLGVDHRMMRFDDEVVRVFGVIDLCVLPEMQGRGIGTQLLKEFETLARKGRADVLVLMALKPELYLKMGYISFPSACTWLKIEEHRNYGAADNEWVEEMMLKQLNLELILTGPVDFLGYLY